MNQEAIRLEGVTKKYFFGESEIIAVQNVSICIPKGDFVVIIGPSGSGKSTMMNLIGALDFSNSGNIYLDGKNIEQFNESELAEIRSDKIGFVFQTFNLIPTLTALENIALPMIFKKIPREERIERAEKILEDVKLPHRKNHLPNRLSGGERQRVAIGRALANNPEIILADEPTGNLDKKTGREILDIFVRLNKKGKTIILVTHDLNLLKYAKRILRLEDGRII